MEDWFTSIQKRPYGHLGYGTGEGEEAIAHVCAPLREYVSVCATASVYERVCPWVYVFFCERTRDVCLCDPAR